jgi:hypothetical protein
MLGRIFPLLLLALLPVPPALAAPFAGGDDPCLDPSALPGNPQAFLVFDDECTLRAVVTFDRTERGFVLSVTLYVADHVQRFVLECARPEHVPDPPIPGQPRRNDPCWSDAWMT